jgi:hypothetical protein
MNKEQAIADLQTRIAAERDPQKAALLMNDLTFLINGGISQTPTIPNVAPALQDSVSQSAPEPALFIPSTDTTKVPVLPQPQTGGTGGDSRTAGDLVNPGASDPTKPTTIADLLKAMNDNNTQSVSVSSPADFEPKFYARPLVNLPQQMFGLNIGDLTSQSVMNRLNLLQEIEDEEKAAQEQAIGYRTGQLQVQRSGLADAIEIAHTQEDFNRIKASGKIPVAARDAQVIIENAKREADAMMRAADQGIQTAAVNERQQALRQIAAGVGAGLNTALNRVDTTSGELSLIRQQAEQARQELLRNIDRRRSAQVDAERLNSRAQIDAMIARLEPMQAVSQLIQADAMDTFQRQLRAEQEAKQRAENARARREQILLNEPQFKASLAALAATAYTPLPGEYMQPPAAAFRAQQGADQVQRFNAAIVARARNAATQFSAHLEGLTKRNNMFTDNEKTIQHVAALQGEVQQLLEDTIRLRGSGALLPDTEVIMNELISIAGQATEAKELGDSAWGPRSAEDVLEDVYKDPTTELRSSLELLKNSSTLMGGNTTPTATGGAKPILDFPAKGF